MSVDPHLLEWDRDHVWHPYSIMPAREPSFLVTGAEGMRLRLADGREVIDAMASWWCAIHGYRHPHLDRGVRDQLDLLVHVMFGGLTHEPAVELAPRDRSNRGGRGLRGRRARAELSIEEER